MMPVQEEGVDGKLPPPMVKFCDGDVQVHGMGSIISRARKGLAGFTRDLT